MLIIVSPQDCRAPATLICPSQGTCRISFLQNIFVPDCGLRLANYVGLEYRFIPCKILKFFYNSPN
jgi:hypothetical protein